MSRSLGPRAHTRLAAAGLQRLRAALQVDLHLGQGAQCRGARVREGKLKAVAAAAELSQGNAWHTLAHTLRGLKRWTST